MKQQFYTHLVSLHTIHNAFDRLEIEQEHREELFVILESHIHHVVLDLILSELGEADKKKFMEHLAKEEHGPLWHLVSNKIEGVEDRIVEAIEAVKEELHKDIIHTKLENDPLEDEDEHDDADEPRD